MKIRMWVFIALVLAAGAPVRGQDAGQSSTPGQNPPPREGGWQGRRGAWGGMGQGRGILGTVTEATPDRFTIKTEAGEVYTVHFSVNTRMMKAPERRQGRGQQGDEEARTPPQAIKPSEIKVGDAITAGGEVDASAKSIGAVFIMQIDPERAKQMREMEANFGKTWLMGRVTAVDGVKVTLQGGPGNQAHSFVADENTSFRRRREPITLGDVQVGDAVRVEGALKDGTFLAATVVDVGQPQEGQNAPSPAGPPGPPQ